MADPFVGEVQIFGFGFAPRNWALAAGQLIPIRQSTALYALYGTTFGGDGTTTFGLPDLAARGACGAGQSPGNTRRNLGDAFGSVTVALTQAELPPHTHTLSAYSTAESSQLSAVPAAGAAIGNVADAAFNAYAAQSNLVAMDLNSVGVSGAGAAHENRQPFLALNFAVALVGNYPSFD